jgi:hypothetical protein
MVKHPMSSSHTSFWIKQPNKLIHSLKIFIKRKLAQAVMLLTCIREVLGSNLGRDTDYPDCEFFLGLPQSL